ncbi:calcium-binding protein [Actibacterium pelagium]|uniref:Ca2+-binding protein, RTX toxin-related n=1 Tax=Actibacterium pelagium TaxID=2029103 RepID=A0A917AI65_9RHOB|nr:calcium-binding protein [Actibacterium pelagium]GGE54902.1 hypothetical protein GCM10011517_23220 [Actibacterium pelagium]
MLQFQQVFTGSNSSFVTTVADLEVIWRDGAAYLFSITADGTHLASFGIGATLSDVDQEVVISGSALTAPMQLTTITVDGVAVLATTGRQEIGISGFDFDTAGTIGGARFLSGLDGDQIVDLVEVQTTGGTYLYASHLGLGSLSTYQVQNSTTVSYVRNLWMGDDTQGVTLADLGTVTLGDVPHLLVLSETDTRLSSYRVANDGTLTQTATVGVSDGLGMSGASALEIVQMQGQDYVLVAGSGSSSISVIALGTDGSMTLTDHVIDNLRTRFSDLQDLGVTTFDDRVFVVAGGSDDGLSLMQLLPDGTLLAVDSFADTTATSLANVSAVEAVQDGANLRIYASSESEAGITEFTFTPGTLEPIQTGGTGGDTLTGGTGNDLIWGDAGDDVISGGMGDDILIGGEGSDTLTGGSGADTFVFSADGGADTVTDFDIGEDRLDLSRLGFVYRAEDLTILPTANGATIAFDGEFITLIAHDGQPIDPAEFTTEDLFGLTHSISSSTETGKRLKGTSGQDWLVGGSGNDVLLGGPNGDTLDGGDGFDTADYSTSYGSQLIDLLFPQFNTNDAAGDTYISIEYVIGGNGPDNMRGTFGDDQLFGGPNVDYIFGRRGSDTLVGGKGDDVLLGGVDADHLVGGENRDRAQYSEAQSSVLVDLEMPELNTGEAAGDTYDSIEDLAGGFYGDSLRGDAQDNRLFGREGNDLLYGRQGNDYLNGGAHSDRLEGGAGNDTLRGGQNSDWFVYSAGADIVEDFTEAHDDFLYIDDLLWGQAPKTAAEVLDYASLGPNGAVFDFGSGNTLTLLNVTDIAALEDDIIIF